MIDWQTENGNMLPQQAEESRPAGKPRLRTMILFLLVLGLLGATPLVYRKFQKQSTLIAQQLVEDRYLLLREAAVLGDEGLFAGRLGRAGLSRTEEMLITEHFWLNRAPLGLSWQKLGTPVISVTLSTNGQEAELTALEPYAQMFAGGDATPVLLAHTMIFTWETDQWVYLPPDRTAGESFQTVERQFIRLAYPGRDAKLAGRLADDLNELVARICTEIDDIQCPRQYQPAIQLSTAPAALFDPAPDGAVEVLLRLPAPVLAGRPVNETAYTALWEGYARQVVRAIVAERVGWDCCTGQLFFTILLDHQLRALGLPSALVDRPDYTHLVSKNVVPNDLSGLWSLSPTNVRPGTLDRARAYVGFLQAQAPEVSIAEWQRRIAGADTYADWNAILETGNAPARSSAAWLSYLYHQAGVAENRSLSTPPDQDVLLICTQDSDRLQDEKAYQVWRYTPQDKQMRPALPGRTFNSTNLLTSEKNGLLLLEVARRQTPTLYAWQAGVANIIWEPEAINNYTWWKLGPQGRYLYVRPLIRNAGVSQPALLDLNSCRQQSCPTYALPQGVFFPTWSPDEAHFLFILDGALYLGNSKSMTWEKVQEAPLSGSYEPFWVDNAHYAYVLIPESGASRSPAGWVPQVARIGENRPEPLFDPAGWPAGLMVPDKKLDRLSIQHNPVDPNQVYVLVEYRGDQPLYVLVLDRENSAWEVLLELPPAYGVYPVLSPDGRWFSFSQEGQFVFFDTVSRQTTEIAGALDSSPAVWTADSEWALTLEDNVLLLARPATGESQVYIDQQLICAQAAWLP